MLERQPAGCAPGAPYVRDHLQLHIGASGAAAPAVKRSLVHLVALEGLKHLGANGNAKESEGIRHERPQEVGQALARRA